LSNTLRYNVEADATNMKKRTCTTCNGTGKVCGLFPVWREGTPESERKPIIELTCHHCEGRLWECKEWIKQGEILHEKRIERRLLLKNAARLLNIDCRTLSRMERGVIEPDHNISYDFPMRVYNKK